MAVLDLSILTKTRVEMFLGRSMELWREYGMLEAVSDAICGDPLAMRECLDHVKRRRTHGYE